MIPAVSITHLTKKFKLQHEQHSTLRELMLSSILFWRRKTYEELIALNDISFDIPQGQTVGIIGENGSGKSTLLKLILGITPPTLGEVKVNGNISALLELGGGFHPDLTGRENIYLNGSILGIPKATLEKRMEEIIDFSELRQFIDTPIKHYSSGMFVRLGFAIAIYIDPEILLVDEVLAVGDIAFQQKCLDRVKQFQNEGKTIIIVSHDLGMIERVCDRAILLNKGKIEKDDDAIATVKIYYERIISQRMMLKEQYGDVQVIPTHKAGYRIGSGEIKANKVRILNAAGIETYIFQKNDPLTVEIEYEAYQPVDNPIFSVGWDYGEDLYINGSNTKAQRIQTGIITGKGILRVHYPQFVLPHGKYLMSVGIYRDPISDETAYDYRACQFSIYISTIDYTGEGIAPIPQQWEFFKPDQT